MLTHSPCRRSLLVWPTGNDGSAGTALGAAEACRMYRLCTFPSSDCATVQQLVHFCAPRCESFQLVHQHHCVQVQLLFKLKSVKLLVSEQQPQSGRAEVCVSQLKVRASLSRSIGWALVGAP